MTIGTAGKATDLITQHVIMVKESEQMPRLQKLLDDLVDKPRLCYRVTTLLDGKSQEQREISLEGFRTKRFNVLVATDVAGRGIDIPDVAHVINYDMPGNIEMYTHRIMLTQSNSPVPPELAMHEASKFEPGSIPDRPPRRNDTVFVH
ncbi:putative RNA helicase [Helianthus anomalus]